MTQGFENPDVELEGRLTLNDISMFSPPQISISSS